MLTPADMMKKRTAIVLLSLLNTVCILCAPGQTSLKYDDDDYKPLFRMYKGQKWDSYKDFISQERSARDGDEDEPQFRSWMLDQYQHLGIKRVKLELFREGMKEAEFEFDADPKDPAGFFRPSNLRKSSYIDLPTDGRPFLGDEFSFEGNNDDRHWSISSSHKGDCIQDSGWLQIIDKPRPNRNRCVCSYENIDLDDLPAIMFARGNTVSRWADRQDMDFADMMQISFSKRPFPTRTGNRAQPMAPQPQPLPRLTISNPQQQQWGGPMWETKK